MARKTVTVLIGTAPSISAHEVACAGCQKSLPAGANFCRRCGQAVSRGVLADAPLAPVHPQVIARVPAYERQAPIAPRARLTLFLVVAAGGAGMFCGIYRARDARQIRPAIAPTAPTLELPPPAVPNPIVIVPREPLTLPAEIDSSTAPPMAGGPFIQTAWVEPDLVGDDGYIGFRVHALVHGKGVSGLRFVAHFRDEASNPITANDARDADPMNAAAVAGTVIASLDIVDVTAFVPLSALHLFDGKMQLQLMPGLFDRGNQPVFLGSPVVFSLSRGGAEIGRVQLSQPAPGKEGLARTFSVKFRVHARPEGFLGRVDIRFKDSRGLTLPGRPPYCNLAHQLVAARFITMPPGSGPGRFIELPVTVPCSFIPSGSVAEISLIDVKTNEILVPAVKMKIPDPVDVKEFNPPP